MKKTLCENLRRKLLMSRMYRYLAGSMIQKYLSIIFIFNMILLVVFSIVLHNVVLFYTREDAFSSMVRQGQQLNNQIDDYIQNMQYILTTLYISKDIKRVIIDSSDAPFEEYMSYKYTFNFIDTLVYARKHIDITLLTFNRQRAYSTDERVTSSFLVDYPIEDTSWFNKVQSSPSSYVFLTDYQLPGAMENTQVAYIAKFNYVDTLDGIVIVASQNDFMQTFIHEKLVNGIAGVVIMDHQDNVLASYHETKELDQDDIIAWCAAQDEGYATGVYSTEEQNYRVTIHKSEFTQFSVYSFISERFVDQRSLLYKWGLTGLLVLVFIVIALFNFIFMKNIIGEIRTILTYANAYQIRPPARYSGRTDEISELSKTVNTMIVQNMEATLLAKDAQIKMLQQQINPHFLYNVLEAIASMALVSGQDKIADVILNLSKVFRYNLYNSNHKKITVTVREELSHLENVFSLYKLRYGDKLKLSRQIEPDVMNCRMIRFVFQPIVENALHHGLRNGQQNMDIKITGTLNNEMIIFKISDNGNGMTADKLAEVKKMLLAEENKLSSKSKGIGLWNVQQRIRLLYGTTFGLSIESTIDVGTTVILMLPVNA